MLVLDVDCFIGKYKIDKNKVKNEVKEVFDYSMFIRATLVGASNVY